MFFSDFGFGFEARAGEQVRGRILIGLALAVEVWVKMRSLIRTKTGRDFHAADQVGATPSLIGGMEVPFQSSVLINDRISTQTFYSECQADEVSPLTCSPAPALKPRPNPKRNKNNQSTTKVVAPRSERARWGRRSRIVPDVIAHASGEGEFISVLMFDGNVA